jgi:methionyl-tRNA formyltransferase
MQKDTNIKTGFAFFGTSNFSVKVLDCLLKLNIKPRFIVTAPDKPVGRKQIMTPNPVKQWANSNSIKFFEPIKLNADFINILKQENTETDGTEKCPVFLVASYGKIIPKTIIDMPSRKTLNIHPSLLPKYRGPSPLPSAILEDQKDTGVTIMRLDEEMDHGPIVASKKVHIENWPTYEEFETLMANEGAELFASILEIWIEGKINEIEQDHNQASFTKKIKKEDGLLDPTADDYTNFRKIQAYHEWPQAFYMINRGEKNIRVKITDADYIEGKLTIKKLIPEGGKEMSLADFERGYGKLL